MPPTADGLEIERKFAVTFARPSVLWTFPCMHIRQVYLSLGNAALGEPEIRVRQTTKSGARFPATGVMTMKWGAGLTRVERECSINAEMVATAFANSTLLVEKLRYTAGPWEIDEYLGLLRGRLVAEIELDAEDAPIPPWPDGLQLGEELTGQAAWSNGSLAREAARLRTAMATA